MKAIISLGYIIEIIMKGKKAKYFMVMIFCFFNQNLVIKGLFKV